MNLFHKLSIIIVAVIFSAVSLFADGTVYTSVNFDDDTFGTWTTQNVASDKNWSIDTYSGVTYAYMNGYGASGDEASEDWLISPELDLSDAESPALIFNSKKRFSGGDFKVMISTDYVDDATTATWIELSPTLASGSSWESSGNVSLDAYKQSGVRIAFKYTSTGGGGGDGAEWQLDDIKVYEFGIYNTVNFDDETFGDWITQNVSSDKNWDIDTYSGVTYAYMNGYGASGDEASEDWLISPELDLSGAINPALIFNSKKRFSGGDFKVMVSTDYVDDATTATWTELSPTLASGSSWESSGNVSLDAYKQSGVRIAFKYTSTGGGGGDGAEWQLDDIKVYEYQETNMNVNPVELFFDDFETMGEDNYDMSPWTVVNVSGEDTWTKYTYQSNVFARISGYGDDPNSEDWLITPQIDLSGYFNPFFNFLNAFNFGGPELQVFVSENYDGSDNVGDADWTELTFTLSGGDYEFVGSGDLDLSPWQGKKIHIGFKYTAEPDYSSIWEVDDFGVYAEPSPVIISQYVETSSGTSPKGIEIWNISGYEIDFSEFPLELHKGTNGGALSLNYTVNSGVLGAGEVLVIGTSDIETYLTNEGLDVLFFEHEIYHNGDDALALKINGNIVDIFGMPGEDPGSAWTGDDVSTKDQNIQLIYNEPFTGALNGWTDPSLRFEYVSDGLELEGFGLAPSNVYVKQPCDRDELFISEYSEGGGNNKYIEIYNGVGYEVDLSDYEIWLVFNDGSWSEQKLSLSGTLANDEVFVIAHSSADAEITSNADMTWGNASWNGNDPVGLAKNIEGEFTLIDQVGMPYDSEINYPDVNEYDADGWFVAGIYEATANFTLVRKPVTYSGNTDWMASAGTTLEDSEWQVLGFEDWSNLGYHATDCNDKMEKPTPVELLFKDFESGTFGEWETISLASNKDWEVGTYSNDSYASMNGYGADEASDEWLISPPLNLSLYTDLMLNFNNAKNYTGPAIQVWVSTDYSGDGNPTEATWTELTGFALSPGGFSWVNSGNLDISGFKSTNTYIAFRYVSTGTGGSDGAHWEIDDIQVTGVVPTKYPEPFPLELGNYHFTEWASNSAPGTYPDNMMFFLTSDMYPSLNSSFDSEYKLAYYYNGGTTFEGLGDDGFSFRTGQRGARSTDLTNYDKYAGAAVLALNTINRNNIRVNWNAITQYEGDVQFNIALQYRVGMEGEYMNLGPEFSMDENFAEFGPITLPDYLENEPYVELRWVYYVNGEYAEENQTSTLAIDEISVTSQSDDLVLISPSNNENVCSEVNADYLIQWKAKDVDYIHIDISTDGGMTYNRLFSDVPAGEEMIEWNVARDAFTNKNIAMKIYDADDATVFSENIGLRISDAPRILGHSDSRVICINDEILTLSVEADGSNLSYQWYNDGVAIEGATNPVLRIEGVEHKLSGYYTAVVSGDEWCSPAVTDVIGVYVGIETKITRQPEQVHILRGQTAWMEVESHIMGVPPQFEPEFQWYQVVENLPDIKLENDGKFGGVHSSIMSITNVQDDYFNEKFYVQITTPCGDVVTSDVVTINEVDLKITQQPMSVSTCLGETIELNISAETQTDKDIIYKWHKNGSPLSDNTRISGSDTDMLTIASSEPSDNGVYTCVVSLEDREDVQEISEEVEVMVSIPPMITSEPASNITVEPLVDELLLEVSADGENLTYQWQKENTGGTYDDIYEGMAYKVDVVREEDGGNYRCIVTNECGADTSSVIAVTVSTGGMVSVGEIMKGGFVLSPAKPNPVTNAAVISYFIPEAGNINLTLTDSEGNTVAILDNGIKSRGEHTLTINVAEYELSAGAYFYTLESDNARITRKLIIVK